MKRYTYSYGDDGNDDPGIDAAEMATSAAAMRTAMARGPRDLDEIPWDWLVVAAQRPGQALQVALGLCRLSQMQPRKFRDCVPIALGAMQDLGVSKAACRRGLRQLEQAGLIKVLRACGKTSWIHIRGFDDQA